VSLCSDDGDNATAQPGATETTTPSIARNIK
jgi:hypothetical protein